MNKKRLDEAASSLNDQRKFSPKTTSQPQAGQIRRCATISRASVKYRVLVNSKRQGWPTFSLLDWCLGGDQIFPLAKCRFRVPRGICESQTDTRNSSTLRGIENRGFLSFHSLFLLFPLFFGRVVFFLFFFPFLFSGLNFSFSFISRRCILFILFSNGADREERFFWYLPMEGDLLILLIFSFRRFPLSFFSFFLSGDGGWIEKYWNLKVLQPRSFLKMLKLFEFRDWRWRWKIGD